MLWRCGFYFILYMNFVNIVMMVLFKVFVVWLDCSYCFCLVGLV